MSDIMKRDLWDASTILFVFYSVLYHIVFFVKV